MVAQTIGDLAGKEGSWFNPHIGSFKGRTPEHYQGTLEQGTKPPDAQVHPVFTHMKLG